MSAYVAFPWVYACVQALCDDLQRVPVKLMLGEGDDAREVQAHPALDLLTQPSTRVTGLAYRQQRIADRVLTGNHFAVLLGRGERPVSMLRLHPARVEVIPQRDGQIGGYRYDGEQEYPWEEIVHVRGVSWEDDARGLLGNGAIQALHNYLTADNNLWKRAAESAKQGRPDAIVSPKDGDLGMWGREQAAEVRERLQELFREAHGGAAVVGHALTVDALTWSTKDMQHIELSATVRDAVLAVLGVPGARIGLTDGVNYANAEAQLRSYWQSRIMPLAAEFDEADTSVVQRFDERLWVQRDFSQVPELQEDATARLDRVERWVRLGYTVQQAAAIEGLEGIPDPEGRPQGQTAPAPVDEDGEDDEQPEEERRVQGVADWLTRADPPTRRQVWDDLITRLHAPAEDTLTRAFRRWQGEVMADVLEAVESHGVIGRSMTVEKNAITDLIVGLFSLATWTERLTELMLPLVIEQQRRIFEATVATLGDTAIEWTTEREAAAAALALNSELIRSVPQTTRDAVALLVTDSVEGGLTASELQANIRAMTAFSPERAVMVARTESTRITTSGTDEAIKAANDVLGGETGQVVKEWVSAHDSAVRRTHEQLDGVQVLPGELFVMSSGARGRGPGDMGRAEEDINCRCVLIPGFKEPTT